MRDYTRLKTVFQDDPEVLRTIELREQNESMDEVKDLLMESLKEKVTQIEFLKGKDAHTPTDEELLALIVPLIPPPIQGIPGEPGEAYVLTPKDKKDIAKSIYVPTVEKVIEKTEVIKEQPIVTEKLIEKDIDEEKLFKEFVKFLKKKRPLNSGDITGMEGFSKAGIKYKFEELMHGGGSSSASVSITYSVDLSAQADGINKVFTVPANDAFILVTGTDAPFVYRPIVDYTGTGTTTLTLDAGVNAPSLGATFILTYKST